MRAGEWRYQGRLAKEGRLATGLAKVSKDMLGRMSQSRLGVLCLTLWKVAAPLMLLRSTYEQKAAPRRQVSCAERSCGNKVEQHDACQWPPRAPVTRRGPQEVR